jgi:hypothetical protein
VEHRLGNVKALFLTAQQSAPSIAAIRYYTEMLGFKVEMHPASLSALGPQSAAPPGRQHFREWPNSDVATALCSPHSITSSARIAKS